MDNKQRSARLFHLLDGVCISTTHESGVIFFISESENMVYFKSCDGEHDGWFHPYELEAIA